MALDKYKDAIPKLDNNLSMVPLNGLAMQRAFLQHQQQLLSRQQIQQAKQPARNVEGDKMIPELPAVVSVCLSYVAICVFPIKMSKFSFFALNSFRFLKLLNFISFFSRLVVSTWASVAALCNLTSQSPINAKFVDHDSQGM